MDALRYSTCSTGKLPNHEFLSQISGSCAHFRLPACARFQAGDHDGFGIGWAVTT
jgi:hypothetical protein